MVNVAKAAKLVNMSVRVAVASMFHPLMLSVCKAVSPANKDVKSSTAPTSQLEMEVSVSRAVSPAKRFFMEVTPLVSQLLAPLSTFRPPTFWNMDSMSVVAPRSQPERPVTVANSVQSRKRFFKLLFCERSSPEPSKDVMAW